MAVAYPMTLINLFARQRAIAFLSHPSCPACEAESGQDAVQLSPVGALCMFSEIHIARKGFVTPVGAMLRSPPHRR